MPPVNRNQPVRAASSDSQGSLMEFMRRFPDDAACLDWLWRTRYAEDGHTTHCPKCDRDRRFHRVKGRPAYDCDTCGHHIHPLAGTIFHKSSTSLHLWFYAMWLITSTRCGISAKQLERELGVTYKTAWRMFNRIRNELMTQDDAEPLSGEVEADETYVGGKPRQGDRNRLKAQGLPNRARVYSKHQIVFGAVERSGRVVAKVIPNSGGPTIRGAVRTHVMPDSILFTDDYGAYQTLNGAYKHRRINHSAKVYVDGDVHTQTIEGFWMLVKNGIRGSYHSVSKKWLQGYLNEYAFRYNERKAERPMFETLLLRAALAG